MIKSMVCVVGVVFGAFPSSFARGLPLSLSLLMLRVHNVWVESLCGCSRSIMMWSTCWWKIK